MGINDSKFDCYLFGKETVNTVGMNFFFLVFFIFYTKLYDELPISIYNLNFDSVGNLQFIHILCEHSY